MYLIDEIEEIADKFRISDGDDTYNEYIREGEKEKSFEEELLILFQDRIGDSDFYSVESMTVFDSPGYDCGIISVAFYDKTEGLLHHEIYMWERI